MSRRLAFGFAVCLFLLVAMPVGAAHAAPYPHTTDEIAEQLATDPIMVQQAMGAGDAAGFHALLTTLADEVDVPVYVVLSTTPVDLVGAEGPAEQAMAILHDTLGEGLYIVGFTDGPMLVKGFGAAKTLDINPGHRAATRAARIDTDDRRTVSPAMKAELILRSATDPGQEITDQDLRTWLDKPQAFRPEHEDSLADAKARRWVYASGTATVALLAGLTVMLLARRAPLLAGRARKEPAVVQTPANLEVLNQAHARFAALRPEALASPYAKNAELDLEAADLVARSSRRIDQVGAWVLAQHADRELDRIAHPTRRPYRPCVINPEHGEATGSVRLVGSSIDAPACSDCVASRGDFLMTSTWRGERPYLDVASVWSRTGFGALVDDLARQVIEDSRGQR